MKKAASIIAVVLMTMSMFSCDNDSADNDNAYDTIKAYNDENSSSTSGGSGGGEQ